MPTVVAPVPSRARLVPVAVLTGALVYGTAARGGESSSGVSGAATAAAGSEAAWAEPASYTCTRTSSAGERLLLGTSR
jgi:hypothetical protein